jgi:hypothetical protein
MNWNLILKKAVYHQVFPFLYEYLMENKVNLPSNALEDMKRSYIASCFRSWHLHHELREISRVCSSRNIETMLMKGAALSFTLYSSPLRLRGDIDLLVKKEQISDIHKSLLQMGYHIPETSRYLFEYSYAFGYMNNCSHTRLDVHWDLFPTPSAYRIDIQKIWQHSKEIGLSKNEAHAMSNEDQFLFLSVRPFEDLLSEGHIRLINLLDVLMITKRQREAINWEQVIQSSRKYQLSLPICITWLYTAKLLGIDLPSNVLEEISLDAEKGLKQFNRRLFLFLAGKKLFEPTTDVAASPRLARQYIPKGVRYRMLQFLLLQKYRDRLLWLEKYSLRGASLLIRKLSFL